VRGWANLQYRNHTFYEKPGKGAETPRRAPVTIPSRWRVPDLPAIMRRAGVDVVPDRGGEARWRAAEPNYGGKTAGTRLPSFFAIRASQACARANCFRTSLARLEIGLL
jgi:hypothetical protein